MKLVLMPYSLIIAHFIILVFKNSLIVVDLIVFFLIKFQYFKLRNKKWCVFLCGRLFVL